MVSPAQIRVRGNELGPVTQAAVQLHGLRCGLMLHTGVDNPREGIAIAR